MISSTLWLLWPKVRRPSGEMSPTISSPILNVIFDKFSSKKLFGWILIIVVRVFARRCDFSFSLLHFFKWLKQLYDSFRESWTCLKNSTSDLPFFISSFRKQIRVFSLFFVPSHSSNLLFYSESHHISTKIGFYHRILTLLTTPIIMVAFSRQFKVYLLIFQR